MDRRSTASFRASISCPTSSSGSAIVTRPIWAEFEAKMSPNDGAMTTSKP
jgi:hypothetical protein